MEDRATMTHAQCRCARIRELNDQLRINHQGGRLVMTRGVASLSLRQQTAMFMLLRSFTAFDTDNDPYGEHDMGSLELGTISVLWKIDYYDGELQFASPDPADPDVTTRVLTLMLAEEY
jgi:hypothetical protein